MLLNDRLETIYESCFAESGLETVLVPASVKRISYGAFGGSSLTQVRFLGTSEHGPGCGLSFDSAKGSCPEGAH